MKITLFPFSWLIKRFIHIHSILGVYFSAIIYVICLSGTLIVFVHEFERWEQPTIGEFDVFSPKAINTALDQFLLHVDGDAETVYVVLPTESMPRAHVGSESEERFTDGQGELLSAPIKGWISMIRDLHYYLHLPEIIGMIIVSIFGVILTALIISGVLSHPSIIKDAFKLRLFSGPRLAQTDIHNRLSILGLPFHIMIAATGSFIGLFAIFVVVSAPLYFDNDRTAAIDAIYGKDPLVQNQYGEFDIEAALVDLDSRMPNASPIYYAFHKTGTEQQFMEIAAQLPQRLTYSEIFRYTSEGEYIDHQGLSDGPVGRQALYSLYRLHFGQFGGFLVKIVYVFFGLALTISAVTGTNIWLSKKHKQTALHRFWQGIVWGLPASFALSAWVSIGMGLSA